MLLLALDLGRWLGFAYGDSAGTPLVGVERLAAKQSVEYRAGALGSWLWDFIHSNPQPDKIIVENYMNPAAIKESQIGTADAIVGQLLLHGAVHCIAGMVGIDVESVQISTSRIHFCGRASAVPAVRGHKRSSSEKNAARRATKQMVIDRAYLLGYMGGMHRGMAWEDQSAIADASCVFDWAKTHIARVSPETLVMFS